MKQLTTNLLMGMLISLAGITIVIAETPIPSSRGPMPFTAFDHNNDGAISRQEFDSTHEQRRQAPNSQGNSARRINDPPQFADFDHNGDGSLSPDEFVRGQNRRRLLRQSQTWGGIGRFNNDQGPIKGTGMGAGRAGNMPSFSEFDRNSDGVLHQQEFEQARVRRIRQRSEQGRMMRNLHNAPSFTDLDTNRDGVVSAQEFTSAQAKHRQP
jgi:Ca2+-binding EF-hand superfamily protein